MEEIINNPSKTSFTINNLKADAVYQVKIKSTSYLGQSNFTDPIQQRVLRKGLCSLLRNKYYLIYNNLAFRRLCENFTLSIK